MLVNIPLQVAVVAPVAAYAMIHVIMAWAKSRNDLEIVAVEPAPAPAKRGLALRLIGQIEKRIFASRMAPAAPAPDHLPRLEADEPLDLVVTLGGAQAPTELVARARLGAIVVDTDAEPAFFDAADRHVSTAFAIRRPGADTAFAFGRIETMPYWTWAQDHLNSKALAYLKRIVSHVAQARALPAERAMPQNLRQDRPGPDKVIGYGLAAAARIVRALAMRPFKRQMRWRVRIAEGAWPNVDLTKAIEVPNEPGHLLADPFVLHHNGRDLLFVEDCDDITARGFLTVYEIKDGRALRLGEALREPFHLSYPFVFEFEGRVLMVPETGSIGEIRVYEAQNFPLDWKPVATLMKDVCAVDTGLFERDGKWWMLTNIDSAGISSYADELHLFWADHPLSEAWTPHPMNPIRFDPKVARNGGFLRTGDKIYRVAQNQDFQFYGRSITVFEIVTLTETNYEEHEVAAYGPEIATGMDGLHHLNSNGRYTVFDIGRYEAMR
jgi:hypothetical protein